MPSPRYRFLVNGLFLLMLQAAGAASTSNLFSGQPLHFEESQAQAGSRASYIARGTNFRLEVDAASNRLSLKDSASRRTADLVTKFEGASPRAKIEASDRMASVTNYFQSNDPKNWRPGVANFGKVHVSDLYPGIDLVFYGKGTALEYDFVIQPGSDPERIKFNVSGGDHLRVDESGALVIAVGGTELRWQKPSIYQTRNGASEPVSGRFEISRGRRIGFKIGTYDHSRPLVIDPVFSYASYFGAAGNEAGRTIATDAAGNVYIAGITSSQNLKVSSNALQAVFGGQTADDMTGDVFIAKFNPSGAMVYATYVGGKGDDFAFGMAVDATGNAYVTGYTNSTNFPVTSGAFQTTFAGSGVNICNRFGDAFVFKINPTGSQLLYSTYLGGRQDDAATAIAIDAAGNAYVTGASLSQDFPTTQGVVQKAFAGSGGEPGKPYCNGLPAFDTGDAFVAKLNPAGSQLVFSTYLGGSLDDAAMAIAIDSSQNVYVAGATISTNFPVSTGAFQKTFGGIDLNNEFFNYGDAFVTKLNSTASSIVYSTYLGGPGDDAAFALVVDGTGTAYVTGSTSSPSFPTTSNAVQRGFAGYLSLPFLIEQNIGDAFVARLNSTGTALLYSTLLGGQNNDRGAGIAVDSTGRILVAGATDSPDFPVTSDAAQKTFAGDSGQGAYRPVGDGFFAMIDPASTKLVYSTFLGGALDDSFEGIAVDGSGNAWLVGSTMSINFPVTPGSSQSSYGGFAPVGGPQGDVTLVKFANVISSSGPTILTDGSGVINGGSYLPGNVVSGSWVAVKGSGFTDQTVDWSSFNFSSGQLPTSLNGVQVLFNGQPGAIWYLIAGSPQQINVQAPANLSGNVSVQVVRNNITSNTVTTTAVASAPGIFSYTLDNGATFYPSAVFLDSTRLGDPAIFPGARKAKAGDKVLLFANSLASSAAGVVSVSGTTSPVTVTIGPQSFPADFSGVVAPGEFQINITVPSLPQSQNYPITLTIGGHSSQAGVLFPYTN